MRNANVNLPQDSHSSAANRRSNCEKRLLVDALYSFCFHYVFVYPLIIMLRVSINESRRVINTNRITIIINRINKNISAKQIYITAKRINIIAIAININQLGSFIFLFLKYNVTIFPKSAQILPN